MKLDYTGLIVNYASLALVAVSGILANVIILKAYTSAHLGVYNFCYALFVVVSQVSCCGVHLSCLKSISVEPSSDHPSIIMAGLLLVFGISFVVVLAVYISIPGLIWLFSGLDLDGSLQLISLAILLYSINKVYMFSANGLGRMTLYAAMQSLRALMLFLYIGTMALVEGMDYPLAGAFLFSEFVLTLVLSVALYPRRACREMSGQVKKWIRLHFKFGREAVLSGLSTELNTRLDVLVLGVFLNDAVVGIYSFASMLVEGFYQLIVVLKNNINPVLAKMIHGGQLIKLKFFAQKIFLICFFCFSVAAAIICALYPVVIDILGLGKELFTGLPVLVILLAFMAMASGWLPFDQILSQAGRPMLSSRLYLIATLINLILNFVLVPLIGANGAALATGISWICFAIMLHYMIIKYLGFNLLAFKKDSK